MDTSPRRNLQSRRKKHRRIRKVDGYRKNSQDIMLIFVNKLDDQDIAAVAGYYQQLPTQRIRDKR